MLAGIRTSGIVLAEDLPGGGGRTVPLPALSKDERVGRIADAADARARSEREEHWRLLYVAMTRAEEALFVGGALGKREKAPAADSWYARLAPLLPEAAEDDIWGTRAERGEHAPPMPGRTQAELPIPPVIPEWARRTIGEEPRPPRPLAPSAAAEDRAADPPLPPEQAAVAARRGVLIHALLERLPDVPVDLRAAGGRAWLTRHAPDLLEAEREEMLARAVAVLDEPQFRDLFGPGALAEVPLAATVGTQVIAGTIDRLLVEETRILVADFKTARRPPAGLEQVPVATLRQMAAYVAALEVIFPGRTVEAAVLYTQVPRLIALPADLLAFHRPGEKAELAAMQESYPG
jgi:ATP-dependent helicase/nuclease subunit A